MAAGYETRWAYIRFYLRQCTAAILRAYFHLAPRALLLALPRDLWVDRQMPLSAGRRFLEDAVHLLHGLRPGESARIIINWRACLLVAMHGAGVPCEGDGAVG
jgi:hypothetical protein